MFCCVLQVMGVSDNLSRYTRLTSNSLLVTKSWAESVFLKLNISKLIFILDIGMILLDPLSLHHITHKAYFPKQFILSSFVSYLT